MNRATEIADELQKLCCAETEGAFFDYVTEAVGTITTLLRQRDELMTELSSAVGYMRNAQIDLETGCTKATAIRTIQGGIRRAEYSLTKFRS